MRDHALIAVLEGRHPAPPHPDLQMVVQGDLTAVLSKAPRPSPRPPQSLRQHLADAITHHALQNACMFLAPLVQVRLETPLTCEGAAACLTANRPFLEQLLTRYAGQAQIQVTVMWQDAAALAQFNAQPDHPASRHQIAQRLSRLIGAEIAMIATEVAPLHLTPELLCSGVVLLPLQDLGDLNRALARLAALWPDGLTMRQIGPDPVNAFAKLDLSTITPRQIEQALTSLGLQALTDLDHLPAIRRRKLPMASGFDDGALRIEINDQAEILAAAARLDDARRGFSLCRIWSDGGAPPPSQSRAVA